MRVKRSRPIIRIAALACMCVLALSYASAQNAAPSAAEIRTKVDDYVRAAMAVHSFSGSILVAQKGQPIVSKGFGMANIELAVPNTPQTVFRLGSVTKQFTAMAIMILQERGKLRVNDPACQYLPECPAAWQPLTIRHLLTHTAGITNYTNFPDFGRAAVLPTTSAELVGKLTDKPLEFAPGDKFAYSNSGYYLLGLIIERASGKSYADFLQEAVFTPLAMTQTGYDNPSRILKNRAAGYARQAGAIVNAAYMDMTLPYAAGGLYSTTEDLLRWDQALYTGTLVSQKSLDEMFTPFKGGYGYGWSIDRRFDRAEISHGGGIYGFATEIARFPADRVTVIVLSNVETAPAGRIANDLAAIVFGAPYEIPRERQAITLEARVQAQYVGEYKIASPPIEIVVTQNDGQLLALIAGRLKLALLPESETTFFSRDVSAQITFVKDGAGQVTGLTLRMNGAELPAQKVK